MNKKPIYGFSTRKTRAFLALETMENLTELRPFYKLENNVIFHINDRIKNKATVVNRAYPFFNWRVTSNYQVLAKKNKYTSASVRVYDPIEHLI